MPPLQQGGTFPRFLCCGDTVRNTLRVAPSRLDPNYSKCYTLLTEQMGLTACCNREQEISVAEAMFRASLESKSCFWTAILFRNSEPLPCSSMDPVTTFHAGMRIRSWCVAAVASIGRKIMKDVPEFPERVQVRTRTKPPCFSTIPRETHNPRPVPFSPFVVKKGSKRLANTRGSMPDPVS